jgi:HPt (histidine-containing phosphotransfer) domain-containing protein
MKIKSALPENYILWDDSVARVGGEEDFLIELLNDLKAMVHENIEKIQKHINKNNYKEIRELAHSMKGASGNLGLNIMYDTTLNLENNAKEQNVENVNKYFKNLEIDYKNLKILLSD